MLRRCRAITAGTHASLLLPWWLGCWWIYNCVCFCCFRWWFAPLYYFSVSIFEGIECLCHLFDKADKVFLFFQSLFQQLILFRCLFSLICLSFLTWSLSRLFVNLGFLTTFKLNIYVEQFDFLFTCISPSLFTLCCRSRYIPLVLHTLLVILVDGFLELFQLGFCIHLNLSLWDAITTLT